MTHMSVWLFDHEFTFWICLMPRKQELRSKTNTRSWNGGASLRAAYLAGAALLGISTAVLGASHTWSGAVDSNWSTPGNWSAGGAPANGETVVLVFPAGMQHMGSMNNDRTSLTISSATFHDTAYVVNGNVINVNGAISVVAGAAGTSSVAVYTGVVLTGTSFFQSASDAGIGGVFGLAFYGAISGGGGNDIHIQSLVEPYGEVVFAHANSYLGTTYVDSGYLVVDDVGGLGSPLAGTVVGAGATLAVNRVNIAPWTITGENLFVGGGGAAGNAALQWRDLTWNGTVTLTEDTTLKGDGVVIVNGVVSGPSRLRVRSSKTAGSGEIDLTQNNTYSQPTQIEYGTVVVTGSQSASDFTLQGYTDVSQLRGTGTVGAVSLEQGGSARKVIAPGTTAATGVLHTGNLSLYDPPNASIGYAGNYGVLSVRLDGTAPGSGYDQVAVTGSVDVTNAELQVDLGFKPAINDSFVIVTNDGTEAVTGAFMVGGVTVPEGGTFISGGHTFQISYTGGTGNDIVLTTTGAVWWDVFWRRSNGTNATWKFYGTGPTQFASGFPPGVPSPWQAKGVGDINGDGVLDVVWFDPTYGLVATWLMNSPAAVTSATFPGAVGAGSPWVLSRMGDVNGDGRADLVWRNSSSGQVLVWLLTPAGTLNGTLNHGTAPLNYELRGIGDFNADGIADLLWFDPTNGVVALWLMQANGTHAGAFPGAVGPGSWRPDKVGDFDGDGNADIFWRNEANGMTAVWYLSGGALAASDFFVSVPLASWTLGSVGDYDADGRDDLLWVAPGTGNVVRWLMQGRHVAPVTQSVPGVGTGWQMIQ
jgi:hypothetical protein